MNGAKI